MSTTPPSIPRSRGALSLTTNLTAGFGSYLISVLITFFLSPYVIRMLGDGRYGVWSLIAELTGYASLLDVGIRGAVSYFVAFHAGKNEELETRPFVATAFWALMGLGVLALFTGIGVAAAFPTLFKTGNLDQAEIFASMSILAATIALTLPCSLLNSILVGFRQQAYANAADIITRILAGAAIAAALHFGGGLVALSLITLGGRILTWLMQYALLRSAPVALSLAPRWFSRTRLRDLVGYGSKSLVTNLALLIIHRMDLVVISAFRGVEFVTAYTLGATLVSYTSQMISSLTRSYVPYFSNDSGANDVAGLRIRFAEGQRRSSLLACMLAGGMVAFGRDFLTLWVGERFVLGPWTTRSDIVLLILLAARMPRIMQSISSQLLYGTRRISFPMWLNLGEAIANISVSLILVRYFGLAGVAMGTLFPSLVTHGLLMPRYIIRTYSIPARDYLWRNTRAGYLTGIVTAAVGLGLTYWLPPTSWLLFFGEVGVTAASGGLCIWTAGLVPYEKARLLKLLPGSRFTP